MPNSKNWVAGLDSLRFILAFIVLLSHYPDPFIMHFKESPYFILRFISILLGNLYSGIGAVIAFFIISGFVIHLPNRKGIPDLKKYFIRRYIRILIPLIGISVVAVMLHCFDSIPIWSLYCELAYYTLYPILFKLNKGKWVTTFVYSFIASTILILLSAKADLVSLFHQKNENYIGGYWQMGHGLTWIVGLPCWLLGILIVEILFNSKEEKALTVTKITIIRFFVFFTSILLNILKFHYYISFIFSMNIFAFLLAYWLYNEIRYAKTNPPSKFFEILGQFSYSLYLCHEVCLVIFSKFTSLTIHTYFLFIFLGILGSYIFYWCIEKPSHILARKLSIT